MAATFETERLVVRDWGDDDADRLLDMYSRDDVVRFLGATPDPMRTTGQALDRIARGRARNAQDPPCGWWAVEVRATGVVAGTVALVPVDGGAVEGGVEVAWHLHPDSQGNGFATEAARAALGRGHDAGLAEILALTDPANTASQAVCRRLGLELRETSDRYYGKALMVWVSRRPAADRA